jgi:hypothetical protein
MTGVQVVARRSSRGPADSRNEVHVAVEANGPASGTRVVTIQLADSWAIRVLLDRGADIGSAWFRGSPIAWTSPIGERAPLSSLRGTEWLSAFGGGLVTTCGLRNVGSPSEGHPLHGAYSHQPATLVALEEQTRGTDVGVSIRTRVDELLAPLGHLRLDRTIEAWTGSGLVTVTDVTTNLGAAIEPAPILYHVNLGAPIVSPEATIAVSSQRVTPRDLASSAQLELVSRFGPPDAVAPEAVFEHELQPDPAGDAHVEVANRAAGLVCSLTWPVDTLPRFHQWTRRSPGWYVLGLEPANCSVEGRAHDRALGRLPFLDVGESRVTRLTIDVRELSPSSHQ